MLSSLQITNFRGFEDHEIPLRDLTIIVGRNNAGKSTIVEALRLVAVVTSRLPNLNFRAAPRWVTAPRYRGVSPDVDRTGFDFKTVFHHYSDPPATIQAVFGDGARIAVHIGPDNGVHAMVFDAAGRPVQDKGRARQLTLPGVSILPQIGPLSEDEEELTEDYVRRTLDSHLASQHFRNQLHLNQGAYRRFRQMVQETWPGVRVNELTVVPGERLSAGVYAPSTLSLFIRNDDFVAEAGRMGHGLQMWLQTMWFLARTPLEATVILDEPDVYMHPDLQRRLLRLVSQRNQQTIIATHSTEIIGDVSPDNILVIDRSKKRSQFAASVPQVQEVIEALGSLENIHLARLWTAKRFLIVEGDDRDILGPLHQRLFPETQLPLQSIPHGEAGGWGGWERAVGATIAMRRAFGQNIKVYCLFDSDYHTVAAISDRYERAERENLYLHVWGRKEIENYLLVPSAIQRLISGRAMTSGPTRDDIFAEVDAIVERLRPDAISAIMDALQPYNKKLTSGSLYKMADRWFGSITTRDAKWATVSGKAVLSELSKWSREQFDVSFGATTIARSLQRSEIAEEVVAVLTAFEREEPIKAEWRQDSAARPTL